MFMWKHVYSINTGEHLRMEEGIPGEDDFCCWCGECLQWAFNGECEESQYGHSWNVYIETDAASGEVVDGS